VIGEISIMLITSHVAHDSTLDCNLLTLPVVMAELLTPIVVLR